MNAKKTIFVVGAVLAIALAFRLYTPIPDGYSPSSARRLQMNLAINNAVFDIARLLAALGYGTFLTNTQAIEVYLTEKLVTNTPDPDVKEFDSVFDGVPVRIYEPVGRTGVLPGFVWYHGGGFAFGSIDSYSDVTRKICKRANVVVVSVGYRLSPEHVFPAAFEDSVRATKFFISNAASFKVDPTRIAIGGDSAGGKLTASVALKLRDDLFEPNVKLQVLVYADLQGVDFMLPSMLQNRNGPLITRPMIAHFMQGCIEGKEDKVDIFLRNGHISPEVKRAGIPHLDLSKLPAKYLVGYEKPDTNSGNETLWNDMKDKLLNGYYSPMLAPVLDNLPSAYVFTGEYDPLRDEGFLFTSRLQEAGVKVTHQHSDIGIHGIISFANNIPEADAILSDIAAFIGKNI